MCVYIYTRIYICMCIYKSYNIYFMIYKVQITKAETLVFVKKGKTLPKLASELKINKN